MTAAASEMPRDLRIDDLLHALPDGPARYHDEVRSLDAAGLRAEVDRVSALLDQAGLRRGDRLALWLPNGLPWLITFFAAARLGVAALAVNTRFRSQDLAGVLGQADCKALVYRPGYRGIDFRAILAGVPAAAIAGLTLRFVVPEPDATAAGATEPDAPTSGAATTSTSASPGIDWSAPPLATHPGADASDDGSPAAAASPPSAATASATARATDDAVIFTTSGTTSLPKLVVHDQHGLVAHGQAIATALAIDAGSTVLLGAPLCGTFGLSSALPALATGAGLVFDAGLKPADLASAIARHRVTHTFCNNELLANILDAASRDGHSLASLRRVGYASFAPALDGLAARGEALGIPLTGLYGSSELQALAAAQPVDAPAAVRHAPGGRLVSPAARVRARDPETGALLPAGVAGAIEIQAPSLMRRYTSAEATTAAITDDGWFRTGDAGVVLDERHFIFHARMGDTLRLSGFLVNPREIEDWIANRPDVAACQVVGVEHQGASVAVAFVLPAATGPQPDRATLLHHCQEGLARYKVPRAIAIVDAFPTVAGANGDKIQRHVLQEQARQLLAAET